jgi:hypothetical protein
LFFFNFIEVQNAFRLVSGLHDPWEMNLSRKLLYDKSVELMSLQLLTLRFGFHKAGGVTSSSSTTMVIP